MRTKLFALGSFALWSCLLQAQDLPPENKSPRADLEAEEAAVMPVEPPYAKNLLQEPLRPATPQFSTPTPPLPAPAQQLTRDVFTSGAVSRSLIPQYRGGFLPDVGTELVFGSEGRFRVTTDAANLLGKSLTAPGVRTQERNPIINDPRIRGSQTGRVSASGSYWMPARQDLDTMLNKIDSRLIGDIAIIKGPYGVMYGPGYDFIDYQLLPTPRYDSWELHGSSTGEFKTNGQQWYGRQSAWGGDENYGYRASYGHRTGNDYEAGNGMELPSSYNSRDVNLALGYNLSDDSQLEFRYLRLDQTGVEFPGLVFDINYLVTDGFDVEYTLKDQAQFDLWKVDAWYNRTRFEGDTSRPGKSRQIPSVAINSGLGPAGIFGTKKTDVDGMSTGYRTSWTWDREEDASLTLGTDYIRLGQELNDTVPEHQEQVLPFPFPPSTIQFANYPIARSRSDDVGLFIERKKEVTDALQIHTGARVDLIGTHARDQVNGLGQYSFDFLSNTFVQDPKPLSQLLDADLDQNFTPWALYLTSQYELDPHWQFSAGVGHAQKPPTLTELYAYGSFIGSLQSGLTFLYGDPNLNLEKRTQFDLGLSSEYETSRFSANVFHAIVNDYITYDDISIRNSPPAPPFTPGQDFQEVAFTNTDLATLTGFEISGEQDWGDNLTGFLLIDYVEGTDHTRSKPARIAKARRDAFIGFPDPDARSAVAGDSEPLPGISPLQARLGMRLFDYREDPTWLLEYEIRMVDQQDRVARSLFEQHTPGFTVHNIRGMWQPRERLKFYTGVENIGNRFYREHLDYRSGLGVFQPGVNFYTAVEWNY
jgi:iron complex outermembrane recepter protein